MIHTTQPLNHFYGSRQNSLLKCANVGAPKKAVSFNCGGTYPKRFLILSINVSTYFSNSFVCPLIAFFNVLFSCSVFIDKKYKGTTNTHSTDFIKSEGVISMSDPKQKMNAANIVTSYESGSGMFIEGTRAFSTDNNPWTDTGTDKLETEADEVSIGELYFGDATNGPVITGSGFDGTHSTTELTGVKSVTAGTTAPTDFSHKFPVRVENADGNIETYYLLLERNTENTSTLP